MVTTSSWRNNGGGDRSGDGGVATTSAVPGSASSAATTVKRNNNHTFASSSASASGASPSAVSPRQSLEQFSDNNAFSSSPPVTPQDRKVRRNSRLKAIQAPRTRPSIRDAFDDPQSATTTTTTTTTVSTHRASSSSHGLSWSPKYARNSVVDNMLLSLDNLGIGTDLSPNTNDYTISTGDRIVAGRPRGLTTSSVSSSEYTSTYDSPVPRIPRHRSNNSANFQSSLGRIDSVRVNGQEIDSSKTSRFGPAGGVILAGRDSDSSSLDLERVEEPKYRHNRRSQSFDHGYTRMALKATNSDPFSQDETETTLSPAIVPLSRTQPSAALRPGLPIATLPSNVHRRNGSARSPVRNLDRHSSESTPVRLLETPSYDSTRGDSTSGKMGTSPGTPSILHGKENQKPGFFRKMFGSSKASQEASAQKKHLQRPPPSRQFFPPDESSDNQQTLPLQRTATREKQNKDQSLSKKTSFFRRRRKSIQDAPMPQVPQVLQDKGESNGYVRPGSSSSLQKVMDQYYESHRRMDSKGSLIASRRKNSLQMSDGPATIRAVRNLTDDESDIPRSHPRTSIDISKHPKEVERHDHSRSASNGGKPEPREKAKPPVTERKSQALAHSRNQSDVDKDLPRLPVDYSAIKSNTPKEVPTSKYNHSMSKPPSRDSAASENHTQSRALTPSKLIPIETPEATPSPRNAKDSRTSTDLNSTAPSTQTKIPSTETRATPSEARATPVEEPSADNHDDLADETKEALMFSVQDVDGPTEEQRAFARKLYDGTSGIDRTEIAPWLGEMDPERTQVRQAYMELFDWKDLSILAALRSFCNHVQLKGETQQVDRLLDALSRRWCECNTKHGFKATDVVHTICYSILLLNTDLHMADIEQKMTRNQFIKNTLPTIRRVVAEAAPQAFDNARASMLPPRRQTEPIINTSSLGTENATEADGRPTHRLQSRPSDHSAHDTINDYEECGPLVKSSYYGKLTGWETQIEVVLKNFYTSIRNQRLPLSGGEDDKKFDPQHSVLSLSAATGSMLRRTNSLLSKAGSESLPSRGRISESRLGGKWSSKGRSRPRLYAASLAHSRTSFDDDQSAISPSMSSMWSKHSLGKTSMSVTSFASGYPSAEYQRSIGFANALSQAITRSDSADESTEEFLKAGPLLEDESLELAGAPWAKEGILKHKHHLESVDKKAKDRNWNECFAVIEKGWIRLFQFNMNSKSVRQRSQRMMGGGVVGGGNWSENAQSLGQFLLRHTIASALPPPGYSKARPHVWALSLPTGAVHLFQAGTPEIVKEFVSTANYWSARLSKEPLMGGVSNIEYGWSERVINMALIDGSRPPSTVPGSRPSMSQSIRTSFDQGSSRAKLPGDKIPISDWTPPTQSMMASQLLEVDQLSALKTYVASIEEDLRKHNELRSPMLLAFTPRSSNHARAMNNWERKSSYLLREIVKFSTYLESLQFAQKEMETVKIEKKAKEEEKLKMEDTNGEVHELVGSTPPAGTETAGVTETEIAATATA